VLAHGLRESGGPRDALPAASGVGRAVDVPRGLDEGLELPTAPLTSWWVLGGSGVRSPSVGEDAGRPGADNGAAELGEESQWAARPTKLSREAE
jgi:hypothetical protein